MMLHVQRISFWLFNAFEASFEDAWAKSLQSALDNVSERHWQELIEIFLTEILGSLLAPKLV